MWSVRKSEPKQLRAGILRAAGAWDIAADALDQLVSDFAEATFFVEYTQGDAAGAVEVLFEGSPVSSGDDWFPLEEVIDTGAVATDGETRIFPVRVAALKLVGTQRAPKHNVSLGAVERVRVRARETGATGTPGSLRVRVRASAAPGGA